MLVVVCLASACTWLVKNTDPRAGFFVTAYRAPVSSPGAQCANRCLANFQGCQNGIAGADRCNNAAADCMNSCPGVTQSEAPGQSPFNGLVARKTCDANLPGPKFCFVMDNADTAQWGIVLQPDYSTAVAPASPAAPAPSESPTAEPAAGGALKVGQAVLARYKANKFWFPGRVRALEGSAVAIAYLDGTNEIVRAQHVKPFDWKVGTAIECNWKQKGKYFAGKITSVSGATDVHIAYDDGDREDTNIALCRSR